MKRWQVVLTAITAMTFFFVGAVLYVFYAVSTWYNANEVKFHAPIEISFYEPIKIVKREIPLNVQNPLAVGNVLAKAEASTREMTKEEIINAQPHAKQIMHIWEHETSKGKASKSDPTALHNKCSAKGKTNEFGYSPFDVTCFDTFEESVQAVERWLEKEDRRALCRYNKGTDETNCTYVSNY